MLCNLLAKETRFKFISTDMLRINYFDELRESYKSEMVSTIYNMLFERINSNIEKNKSIIVEGMFLTNRNRTKILDYDNEMTSIAMIFVTADFNVLLDRLRLRDKKENGNVLQQAAPLLEDDLVHFYEQSQPPKSDDLIVNTSHCDVAQSFSRLKSIISKQYSADYIRKNIIY